MTIERVGAAVSRAHQAASTRERLIAAASAAFEAAGFDGTNSNEIARGAGFAPQTFYRHFSDKLAIFLAVYQDWVRHEYAGFDAGLEPGAIAAIIAGHHRRHRNFRRALSMLTRTEPRVTAVRTASRRGQIAWLGEHVAGFAALSPATQLARLLTLERLADAIAEEEFAAFGVGEDAALEVLAAAIRGLTGDAG